MSYMLDIPHTNRPEMAQFPASKVEAPDFEPSSLKHLSAEISQQIASQRAAELWPLTHDDPVAAGLLRLARYSEE